MGVNARDALRHVAPNHRNRRCTLRYDSECEGFFNPWNPWEWLEGCSEAG